MKRKLTAAVLSASLMLVAQIHAAPASGSGEQAAAVCAGCHGPGGRSAVPDNPILAAQHADYLRSALQAYISGERDNGIMKTMAGRLTAEATADIIAYYANQPPHQSQASGAGDAARGESKVATCVACHGTGGRSGNPMFPNLAGQHAVYLSKALRAYRSGARRNTLMRTPIIMDLTDQDIEDIAAYYASRSAQP